MNYLIRLFIALLLLITFATPISASERPLQRIALLVDDDGPSRYQELLKQEIETLLGTRYRVEFTLIKLDSDAQLEYQRKTLQQLMTDPSADIIIGLSMSASELLAEMGEYSKPVIAGTVLDHKLQGLPQEENGTSGIDNFNYIQSPFDVEKDIKTFRKLYDFKHLAVVYEENQVTMFHLLYTYFGKVVESIDEGIKLTLTEINPDTISESLAALPETVDAVYLPPLFLGKQSDKLALLIEQLNRRRLPTFALLGEENVRSGAMASIAPDRNISAISRRIAINVLDIAAGRNAGNLPVKISQNVENFVVNVETLKRIDYYPSWSILNDARLINVEQEIDGSQLFLVDVIKEALQANLTLQIERLNTDLSKQDVGLARSPLLPQISLQSSYDVIDKNRADGSPASPAPYTWSAGGRLSQTLFSDDEFANYSISKLILESQKFQEQAEVLDTVVEATEAFINLLFARTNQVIQNNNLAVTRKNLDIAKSKEAVGSVGASEVHRWESEQASNKISLNDAYRDVRLAKLALNRLLNRAIDNPINPADIEIASSIELLITDEEVYSYLENIRQLAYFNDFLISEADRNLPELKDIAAIVESQKREVLNRERAFYLPDIQLQGQIDKVLDEQGTDFDTPSDLDHPWSIAAVASWPLFSGNSRSYDLERSRLQLRQTELEAENLQKELNLQVSANLETAAVSAREIALSRDGLQSAERNFEIIQAGYAEGRNTIADLIDAQNAKINAERGEAIAKYQFVLDFLILERSVGKFYFLSSSEEKQGFIYRLHSYMESRK